MPMYTIYRQYKLCMFILRQKSTGLTKTTLRLLTRGKLRGKTTITTQDTSGNTTAIHNTIPVQINSTPIQDSSDCSSDRSTQQQYSCTSRSRRLDITTRDVHLRQLQYYLKLFQYKENI